MGYSSSKGKRPMEYASKASHGYLIKDKAVQEYLEHCNLPKKSSEVTINPDLLIDVDRNIENSLKYIIAVDGGLSEVSVQKEFPSAKIAFFQFGAIFFKIEDLDNLSQLKFIAPEDISKLKNIERLKLVIPTKNITYGDQTDLISSVRETIYNFFANNPETDSFLETLKWFLFEEYYETKPYWHLATCPNDNCSSLAGVHLEYKKMRKDYTFKCPYCGGTIYITDVFRLHEVIDNELGAGGIHAYLIKTLEQILLIHIIKLILKTKPSLLKEILFIKDGPLGFFGQTARMHVPMRNLMNYLTDNHDIFLVGLEKSGAFVEHADEISNTLKPDNVLLLSNDYIYKYVLPGKADLDKPYARTSYYGSKLFFKSYDNRMYVATLPVRDEKVVLNPKKENFHNLDLILHNVEKLKCDMYDNSLIPVALVNRLVSLSNHPSSMILEKFARNGVK